MRRNKLEGRAINKLRAEFERIQNSHKIAMVNRVARVVLGPSVIRVFAKGTKPQLQQCLSRLPVDELPAVVREERFNCWYETQLEMVAISIRKKNKDNSRVHPGRKWGHAAKVLSIFLRDLVEHSRYFADNDVKKIRSTLHVPIDRIVIDKLRSLGIKLPCRQIKEIDSKEKFYSFQEALEAVAKTTGVPRIWFDDNWGDR